jgi:hypothetical protein
MRVRYTDTALVEIDQAVSYLLEHHPPSGAAFADLI